MASPQLPVPKEGDQPTSPSPQHPTTRTPCEDADHQPQKVKPDLTGSQATALISLYGRHLEATSEPASSRLLNDTHATETVSKIDFPFNELQVGGGTVTYVGLRSKQIDDWALDFVARSPTCTVINVACGLDSRALRLDCGHSAFSGDDKDNARIRWIDIDLPDVVEFRKKVITPPKAKTKAGGVRDYTLLSGSATDENFIRSLPNDRPTILLLEGLSAYLQPEDGKAMIQTICAHFSAKHQGENEIVFEAINWFTLALQGFFSYLKRTEADLHWGIDDCKELEKLHDGLVLLEEHPVSSLPGLENSPTAARFSWWLSSWFAFSKNSLRHVRFKF